MPQPKDDDPLFVRVEGYKVILQELEAIRQILENMGEAITVLNKVDRVKEQSVQTFLENIDRLYEKLETVGQEMPRVDGSGQPREEVPEEQVPQQPEGEEVVNDSIRNLHSELQGLKQQLDDI